MRRGIIEGCNHFKTLTKGDLRFNDFIKEDDKKISIEYLGGYVGVLESFLPLNEPQNKERFYKLFVRTLAHEWEESVRPRKVNNQQETLAFSWIMKMTRNWMAHTKLFEQLTSQDIAFLFIINMRAMLDLGNYLLPYEQKLLSLFSEPLPYSEMKNKMGDNHTNRRIPLVESYRKLLQKTGNTWQAINFHDALNNLQKNKQNSVDKEFFITGLYQIFWFLTSSGRVYIPDDKKVKNFSRIHYQFIYFNYETNPYLFEIARHIYNRSFY